MHDLSSSMRMTSVASSQSQSQSSSIIPASSVSWSNNIRSSRIRLNEFYGPRTYLFYYRPAHPTWQGYSPRRSSTAPNWSRIVTQSGSFGRGHRRFEFTGTQFQDWKHIIKYQYEHGDPGSRALTRVLSSQLLLLLAIGYRSVEFPFFLSITKISH